MSGRIEMVRARDLRDGDVFSTDGYKVVWVCELSGGGAPTEISVITAKGGHEKQGYLAPDQECPIWREK